MQLRELQLKLAIVTAACFFYACKGRDVASDALTVVPGDTSLKIAVNYMGASKCIKYMVQMNHDDAHRQSVLAKNRDLTSHQLDGGDGELISNEYKAARGKQNLRFSGDKFFSKSATNKLAMETIASHCRRLVLSVDAKQKPTLAFTSGFAVADQQEKFREDFVEAYGNRFGDLRCEGDFCTFSNIKGGKRYFVYIEPGKDEKIAAKVTYDGKTKTITVGGLYYQDASRYRDGEGKVEPPVTEEIDLNTRVAQLKAEVECSSDGGGNECSKPGCPMYCTIEVKRSGSTDIIKDTFTLSDGLSFDICNANSDFCNQRLEDAYKSSDKLHLDCRIDYQTNTCEYGLTLMDIIYAVKTNRACMTINRTQGKLRTVNCDATDFRHKVELSFSPKDG